MAEFVGRMSGFRSIALRNNVLNAVSVSETVKNHNAINNRVKVKLAGYEVIESRRELTGQEKRDVLRNVETWTKENIPLIPDGKNMARRAVVSTADGHTLFVGNTFFNETYSKCKHASDVATTMRLTTEFAKWIPLAKFVKPEPGKDHKEPFNKFRVTYQGYTLEFKAKLSTGEILYVLRVF